MIVEVLPDMKTEQTNEYFCIQLYKKKCHCTKLA